LNLKVAAPERKAEVGGSAKTQAPPYFVEIRPGEAEGAGGGRQAGSSEDAPPPHEALAEALAAAKARWVEVNQEVLEANPHPAKPVIDLFV
jgi:hypothetical protein